ncbi:MAG: hydroxymethylglutaryl-CoA lyase [Bdellovibrionia bacterium]
MKADSIHIFEVGPRDGIQNEPKLISLKDKLWFVSSLIRAGIRDIELGAFVRPDLVPQMADTDQVYTLVKARELRLSPARAWCLVPNRKALERALHVGVTNIAIFTAATESFTKKNIGMSIRESLKEFQEVIREGRLALGPKLRVRGYVSTAFGCPFEGKVSANKALRIIEKVADLGVNQVSIGDTIGVGTPADVTRLVKPVLAMLGEKLTAVHFHDTRGTALANVLRSIDLGVRNVDSSAGGLGGCPFAPGASGNLATEDLVYMLNGMGMKTGINLESICEISLNLSKILKRPLTSRYLQAYASQCAK